MSNITIHNQKYGKKLNIGMLNAALQFLVALPDNESPISGMGNKTGFDFLNIFDCIN
jgi:hypothetical protein